MESNAYDVGPATSYLILFSTKQTALEAKK